MKAPDRLQGRLLPNKGSGRQRWLMSACGVRLTYPVEASFVPVTRLGAWRERKTSTWSASRVHSVSPPTLQTRDLAVAKSVDEQPVVVAGDLGVAHTKVHHLLDEFLLLAADRLDDLILGLEVDDGRVGVFVRDAVHLGGRPTEVVQHRSHLLGF